MNKLSNEKKNEIKKETIKEFNVWNLNKKLSTDKILPIINNDMKSIKQLVNILIEENEQNKEKKYYNYKSKVLKRTNSTESYNIRSSKTKTLLNKIEQNLHNIQDSTNKMINLNDLYMNHTSRDSNIFKFQYSDNENKNEKNITNYSFFSKKNFDKKIKNFEYITNNNRKQLKNAFMKFNPYFHLENLHMLEKSFPFIQNDISTLKKEIDEDIKDVTDIHKLKKKYEKIQNNNYKSKSSENILKKDDSSSQYKKVKYIKKHLDFFQKDKKTPKIKSIYREDKIEEINKILNCTGSIKNFIDNDYINTNIEKYVNDYSKNKYNNENKFIVNTNEYFSERNKEIIDYFKELYSFRLNRVVEENEKRNLNRANRENENFSNKVLGIKNSFLNELNSYLQKNEINLNPVSLKEKDNIKEMN